MESRHGEGQRDKQGLYQRKKSDRVLTTYTRYVLGWAASEEFLLLFYGTEYYMHALFPLSLSLSLSLSSS